MKAAAILALAASALAAPAAIFAREAMSITNFQLVKTGKWTSNFLIDGTVQCTNISLTLTRCSDPAYQAVLVEPGMGLKLFILRDPPSGQGPQQSTSHAISFNDIVTGVYTGPSAFTAE